MARSVEKAHAVTSFLLSLMSLINDVIVLYRLYKLNSVIIIIFTNRKDIDSHPGKCCV